MEFSSKIKKLRTAKGLTQKQIADYLNVSQNAIYNWENGKREPNMDMQKKIAKFFDFPLYLLLDDNFELENVELEMKRARPVNSYEMAEPPKPFTRPLQGIELPQQYQNKKFDYLSETYFNAIRQKMARKEPLTKEEEAYRIFHLSEVFRINIFARYYFTLNKEGKNKANEIIDRAIEQIALLNKIPEYQPKIPPDPPQE